MSRGVSRRETRFKASKCRRWLKRFRKHYPDLPVPDQILVSAFRAGYRSGRLSGAVDPNDFFPPK